MNKVPITVCLIALSMILSCALDDKRVCNPGEWGCLNNNFARCNDGAWDVEIYCAETEKCNSSTRTCDPLNNPDKLNCNDDEHIYENACEPNDIQNCGKHGTVCEVKNAKNSCTNGQCTFECNDGYHEYNNICELNEFITVWDLPDSDYEINFPLQDLESKVTIDWGDDNVDRDISPSTTYAKHIFSKKGKYTIKVRGKINQWSCKRASNESTFCDGLIKIQSYGETTFGSYAFYKATNLTSLPQGITPRFANQSMEGAFYGASSFNQDISFWDTSSITNMSKVFCGAQAFNQPLNDWDTSKVTTISSMFYRALAFNQPLDHWNTANITDMSEAFFYASAFNQSINDWDTAKVTNMSKMFNLAYSFDQPLNKWNTSNVTNMSQMFNLARAFNQPIEQWNTSKVTNMSQMFTSAALFNQPLAIWNTSNVTNMTSMFNGADAFDQPLNDWNTSHVTDMSKMFNHTLSFNQPLDQWDTSNVTDMSAMFYGATTFNQPLDNWDTSHVTDMSSMFYHASSFNQPLEQWDISNVTNMNFFFTSSGIDQDNYCALYMGDYGTYWIKKQNVLGISYTCN